MTSTTNGSTIPSRPSPSVAPEDFNLHIHTQCDTCRKEDSPWTAWNVTKSVASGVGSLLWTSAKVATV